MSRSTYRFFCRSCRHYQYSRKLIVTCERCSSSDLRKDVISAFSTKGRNRPRGCCGKKR